MKALVYSAAHQLEFKEVAAPSADTQMLRVAVSAAGICGSDMHAWAGHDPRRVPPMILGHEFVGTVMDGAGKGRRVTANPLVCCGYCRYCLQDRGNLCMNRSMIGMNIPGAFADELLVPEQCLIDLPADMSDRAAALTEPAGTVLHGLNLAQRCVVTTWPQTRCLVIGGGAIGLLAALRLKSMGVSELTLIETNVLRRNSAKDVLQCECLDPREAAPAAESADFVFDAVGSAATRQLAMKSVAAGGVVLHVGLADWASEIDMRRLTLAEISLLGCYTYTQSDLQTAAQLLASGGFGDLAWVQERPLSQGQQAFEDIAAGRVSSAKVLLTTGS